MHEWAGAGAACIISCLHRAASVRSVAFWASFSSLKRSGQLPPPCCKARCKVSAVCNMADALPDSMPQVLALRPPTADGNEGQEPFLVTFPSGFQPGVDGDVKWEVRPPTCEQ